MIIFHSESVCDGVAVLTPEDSLHCARVLRHRAGDEISVIDGAGTMYECVITDASVKAVTAAVRASHPGWNSHPYHLTMAVCPTKNNDRFEWFVEKATEIGVDEIVPLIGERSERKVYKTERAAKIALSAAKQSLKASVPVISEPVSVKEFLSEEREGAKYIAYCFEDEQRPRISLMEAIVKDTARDGVLSISKDGSASKPRLTILIGPEGDFSDAEAALSMQKSYIPIHLGESRLRTETAAVVSATMVYSFFLK